MTLHARLLLLSLLGLALACDDDDDVVGPVRPFAAVRMFDAAAIDTLGMLWGDVETPRVWTRFRTVSDCIQVPAAERQSLRFRQIRATTDVATVDTTLVQGGRYTVIVAGTAAPRRAVLLQDVFTPPDTASILVRFINATSTPGDVHATPPNGALGAPTVANLPVIAAGSPPGFTTLPRANTQIRLFDPGVTTGTPRANITLTGLPTNRVTSVVFLDVGTPAGATAVRIDPCT